MGDSRRYYGLDALRGGMMLLGVVLHSAESYLSKPPPQFLGFPFDRNSSFLFDVVFHFIHSFRMPLFFVLAGFFAALLVEKRGMWGTYRDRAARVLAPMLVAAVTILPITFLFLTALMVAVHFGEMKLVPDRAQLRGLRELLEAQGAPIDRPTILHLWFLLYLCYFYLLLPLCRGLSRLSEPVSAAVARFLDSPAALVCLGLCTAATLLPFRGGQVMEGFLFLEPHAPSILYYGSFFVFGYFIHRHRGMLQAFVRYAPACTLLSLVLFPLALWLGELDSAGRGSHLASALANGFCTWTLIYAFTGWTLRLFDRESPWILYISQSAYWVYLAHLPCVMLATWLLVPHDLPAAVKFSIVFAFTTLFCFTSYHYLVQRTWVGKFLHGRRFDLDWPWRAKAPAKVPVEA